VVDESFALLMDLISDRSKFIRLESNVLIYVNYDVIIDFFPTDDGAIEIYDLLSLLYSFD
jgi:hypothetical protein